MNNLKPYGTILLVTDTFFDDLSIVQTDAESLDKINGEFDCVLINLNKSIANESDEKITALLLKTL
ncbi:MAG: hypothetical protein VZR10_07535, partial [Methanobrevibacter sp.]|nr:hypothetical protein [Methanobrevibacter sp.]